ncbi:MAG: Lrp/AsnC ligand binding domain-containing protein [Pseudomonadota bacterium]
MSELDPIDIKMLAALQENGRITVTELAEKVHLSKTPCTERVRRLEREGYISGYRAMLVPERVGLSCLVFVQVTLERTTTDVLDRFNEAVSMIQEVEAAHMIAGGYDYLLKVRARDMTHYRKVLGDQIGELPGVSSTSSFSVMETVVEGGDIAKSQLEEISAQLE